MIIEFDHDEGTYEMVNSKGDTYTTKSEDLMDFLTGCEPVQKDLIAGVVKRYTISYTTRKGKGVKVIEIDSDSEINALGKFCLEVPLGLWVQIRSEDE